MIAAMSSFNLWTLLIALLYVTTNELHDMILLRHYLSINVNSE